ncbi:coiled-coil domain-containing protein 57 [Puma concolor]|uniref:Coiled-coil domain-containing protein 57 n=1 Tax=Puma concolor TaxID=9696 RepID=A0A6P6I8N0_PUMCO|nr:coiled-coil domain-containing protein 57 [Puma concolor]
MQRVRKPAICSGGVVRDVRTPRHLTGGPGNRDAEFGQGSGPCGVLHAGPVDSSAGLLLTLQCLHSEKNGEIDQQREQYENLKWRLERKLEELDGELALQRQELLLELESEMQKREHEFRLQADRMSSEVLTHELKVKLLDKELAALKEAAAQAAESLRSAEAANSELRDQLQRGGQELRDLAAAKDTRIKDLEGQLHSEQQARKKEEEAFRRKLREEASALKSGWDAQVAQLSKDLISKDLRIQALQEEAVELKAQLARCQQDVGRWCRIWSRCRGSSPAPSCVGKHLFVCPVPPPSPLIQWMNAGARWSDVVPLCGERRGLSASSRPRCLLFRPQPVAAQSLHTAPSGPDRRGPRLLLQGRQEPPCSGQDGVAAKLQETERTLCDQEVVLKALTLERDQAVQALRTRGLLPEKEVRVGTAAPRPEPPPGTPLPSPLLRLPRPPSRGDYIMVLETEIRNLKHKFKTLEGQVEDVLDPSKMSSSHSDVQASVHILAEVPGGAVPADGTPMGLALGRLRNRTHLLNFLVARLRQKLLQKPLGADTVQHELPHEVGQVHLEALELQKQVAELEEHIGSHWRLRALDQVALARQVPADQGPKGTKDQKPQPPQVSSVPRLQRKLKEAAREIVRLRLEKEQLLETGNRLRAELGRGPALCYLLDLWLSSFSEAFMSEESTFLSTGALEILPRATGSISERARHRQQKPVPKVQRAPRPQGVPETADRKPPHQPLPTPEAWNQSEAPLGQVKPHSAAQGSKSAETEHSSGHPGEARPHLVQSVSRRSSPPGCTAGAEAGSGQRQHGISRATYRSARQKESRSPKPHLAQESREEKSHHTRSSSSPASGPLQDTWKLLDLGSSPSGLTSQDDSVPELTAPPAADSLKDPEGSPVGAQAALAIEGVKAEAQAKARPARTARAHPAKTKCCQRPPKIRNYNLKD